MQTDKQEKQPTMQAQHSEETAPFGFREVKAAEKHGLVQTLFGGVAHNYDLMNDLMSGGVHRLWKSAMLDWLAPRPGMRLLDVAGGTGDVAMRYARAGGTNTSAVLCDISPEMMDVGKRRVAAAGLQERITFAQGNAEALPFADKTFDAYTIAFGIRNVPRIDRALSEARRVLKRGGRFLCLEFSQVDVAGLDKVYDFFSFNAIPVMGRMVTGDGEPYRYLVESIRKFPNQERFADMIREAGFSRVSYRNYSGGIACLHSGWAI
jgi:demethylmenaquinone methyltransferase/2-methoxy-6-polyprenyl-1,4-benzoquinol methylase